MYKYLKNSYLLWTAAIFWSILNNSVKGIGIEYHRENKSGDRAHKKRGYSLVELMIGATLLTVVLAGTFSALGQALFLSEKVQHSNFVTELLQSELNEVNNYNWDRIITLPASESFDPAKYFSDIPLKNYTCTRTVVNHPTYSNMKEIRLTVTWDDMRGKSYSRELVSYYAKGGMNDYNYEAL